MESQAVGIQVLAGRGGLMPGGAGLRGRRAAANRSGARYRKGQFADNDITFCAARTAEPNTIA